MPRGLVLSVGSQPATLALRNQVLAAHGYVVVPAHAPEEAVALLQSGVFDLTVVCHSIAPPERDTLISSLKSADPSAPVLVIDSDEQIVERLADDVVGATDSAEVLLAHADGLVGRLSRAAGA